MWGRRLKSKKNRPSLPNRVQLIGGRWGGQWIHFPSLEGLRPTLGRIRETLFNWLMVDIRGAQCLDLFAGSGSLSFEALSRGARQVVACDTAYDVARALMHNAEKLGIDYSDASCTHSTGVVPLIIFRGDFAHLMPSPYFLSLPHFNIVFIDPPFLQPALLNDSIRWLEKSGCLAKEALIYVESQKTSTLSIPDAWVVHRQKETAQIRYSLYINTRSIDANP